ncbi:M20/M25/M40 family metallo-hydrolase [Legionella pneumophila]|uniref:aminopeptidase LapB n=1 Tax=Legionella pneumophila TaxID=446 RepID=UPI0013752719|nr:M20/M25/M40 family metallo-hydrolase [Legionella pneumophila]HAT8816315.1 M20/M25/M40 family metallo-hydrolase [Legionella pneumophila subsp. pneumophila]MCZ4805988.1 M20/M25/M40 family metallo-hydrolase [Legionella pneumophila]MDW9180438.1 M20/M25/M40 family metallo-hydrolase [Legionella pneumophila]HAT1824711.1 M20/M25/M40 family metallo-hydrolase [Legionella pneumophila]HAT1865290.1 M20/M25/M40 family metallo-hydrolase [Legionella pneumophila]
MVFKSRLVGIILLCFSSITGWCLSQSPEEDRIIVSNCLYEQLKDKARLIAQSDHFSFIAIPIDENITHTLQKMRPVCGNYLNAEPYIQQTSNRFLDSQKLLDKLTSYHSISTAHPYPINHEAQVHGLFEQIDPAKIWQINQHLTSYINRSAKSRTGVEAAQWFKKQFDTLAQDYGRKDVESYFVKTGNKFIQPSVVTVIGKDKPGEAIVIGAHIDTLDGNMPGADDDSSGISVELEMARVLFSSNVELNRPVYFIAYAAEERGLIGSGYVVQDFLQKKIQVKAVMQLDQAGYRANTKDQTIWLLKDYVDKGLTEFTAELLTRYVKIPVGYTKCGYACSDHVNWTNEGFKTTYPSATTLDDDNPYVHTSNDTLDILNLEHMVNFTKLGLAFIVELGLN